MSADGSPVVARFYVTREWLENDELGKDIPKWAQHLAFGGYREQGWCAFDQRRKGAVAATGRWGDELRLHADGTITCTAYPDGYSAEAAIEKGRAMLTMAKDPQP